MARTRSIQPEEYLAYLEKMWDAREAARALGCDARDIRALQTSRRFVEEFLRRTIQLDGPEGMTDLYGETVMELIGKQKFDSFFALRALGMDENVPAGLRARIHTNFVEKAIVMEGYKTTHREEHEHVHRLDPETARALEDARRESARLIAAPIDVTAETA